MNNFRNLIYLIWLFLLLFHVHGDDRLVQVLDKIYYPEKIESIDVSFEKIYEFGPYAEYGTNSIKNINHAYSGNIKYSTKKNVYKFHKNEYIILGEAKNQTFINCKLSDDLCFYLQEDEWFYTDSANMNGGADVGNVVFANLKRDLEVFTTKLTTNHINNVVYSNDFLSLSVVTPVGSNKIVYRFKKNNDKYYLVERVFYDGKSKDLLFNRQIVWNEAYTYPMYIQFLSFQPDNENRKRYSKTEYKNIIIHSLNEDFSVFEVLPKVYDDQERYDWTLKKWLD